MCIAYIIANSVMEVQYRRVLYMKTIVHFQLYLDTRFSVRHSTELYKHSIHK